MRTELQELADRYVNLALPENGGAICSVSDEFFADLHDWYESAAPANGRVIEPLEVSNRLSDDLQSLAQDVKQAGDVLKEETERQDFIAAHDRLIGLASEIHHWHRQLQQELFYTELKKCNSFFIFK